MREYIVDDGQLNELKQLCREQINAAFIRGYQLGFEAGLDPRFTDQFEYFKRDLKPKETGDEQD